MTGFKAGWLPHLRYSIPKEAYGYSVSMYSIALEGWRRGLTVRFINKNTVKAHTEFILSNKKKRYRFSGTRGNIISKETINICMDKYHTKKLLKEFDVPVLEGEMFAHDEPDEDIINYVKGFGYPIVVKPYNGNSGEGVIVNIQNETTLKEALVEVRQKLNHSSVLIERYIPSHDYQLYIINDKVKAAFERVRAYVIGDGEKTIKQLIKQKNNIRRKNPGLQQHLIGQSDKNLKSVLDNQGLSLETVLEKDQKAFLQYKSNVSAGGETIDITNKLSKRIKKIAINAANAIPNLPTCAVEIVVDKTSGEPYVLEVKTQPTLSGHLFPVQGKARDVVKEIVDYYFPETMSKKGIFSIILISNKFTRHFKKIIFKSIHYQSYQVREQLVKKL